MRRNKGRWIGGVFVLTALLSACTPKDKGESGPFPANEAPKEEAVQKGPAATLVQELPPIQGREDEEADDELITAIYISPMLTELIADENAAKGGQANILLSPMLLWAGAEELAKAASPEAAEQIRSTILCGNEAEGVQKLLERLEGFGQSNAGASWTSAGSVWKRESAELDEINGWVSGATGAAVTGFADSDAKGTELFQAMDLSFEWATPYEEKDILESRHFMSGDWNSCTVTMLYSEEECYFQLSYGTGFMKDLKGGKLVFFAVMPDKDVALDDYIALLQTEQTDIVKALLSPQYGDVRVQLPEFSVSYDTDLTDALTAMGYDPTQSGFQFADGSSGGLAALRQHVSFRVERGQCAPNTDKVMKKPSAETGYPIYLIFDRPFLYGVADKETGVPIVMGLASSL